MKKEKEETLKLLKQKINGELVITYNEITRRTGYKKAQLIRLSKEIEKRDINSILIHGNKGRKPSITASSQEVEYLEEFKKKYPEISISQFMDIYHEDVIWNKEKQEDVIKYGLKVRSKSFFQQLYKKENWKSPIKHRYFNGNKDTHSLREPSPRIGMLIMVDGTPHDWFGNGKKFSLHLSLDDATGKLLSGWFTPNECIIGYCYMFKLLFEKHGIPQVIYADRTSILWTQIEENQTQVARMLDELGIELIFANTSQAKGKIERMNNTIQNRLLNDIKRYNIKTYDELNKWFNDFYIGYINHKFSYPPKEEETEFVPLGNTDLTKIMCIKEERTILNGNMISYKNEYYIAVNDDLTDYIFYKGTKVEIWVDIFNNNVRLFKNGKLYNTRKITGHRKDPIKREQKRIQDQKILEQVLRERDERLKARRIK